MFSCPLLLFQSFFVFGFSFMSVILFSALFCTLRQQLNLTPRFEAGPIKSMEIPSRVIEGWVWYVYKNVCRCQATPELARRSTAGRARELPRTRPADRRPCGRATASSKKIRTRTPLECNIMAVLPFHSYLGAKLQHSFTIANNRPRNRQGSKDAG